MSEASPQPDRRLHRAKIRNWRLYLVIESVAVIGLVTGTLWLVHRQPPRLAFLNWALNPGLWLLIGAASVLGTLVSLAPYFLGQRGAEAVFDRYPDLQGQRWEQLESSFQRWGSRALLLTAVPALGLALSAAAGAFGIGRKAFLVWVFLGQMLRNWILVLAFLLGREVLT